MTRARSHEYHVRILASGCPRAASYRVIAESGRAALAKATRHVAPAETFFVCSVQRVAKNVDPSAYSRDCELDLTMAGKTNGNEDTREPFRADLARPADPGRE